MGGDPQEKAFAPIAAERIFNEPCFTHREF